MPIQFDCPQCGKKTQAPDTLAGKQAKCPYCQAIMTVPEPVFEAELSSPPPQGAAPGFEMKDSPPEQGERRPCPMCGEMILASAVKCRFCGEIFDKTLSAALGTTSKVDPELLRKFRREMHGLGGAWIFFGVICLLAAGFLSSLPNFKQMNQEELFFMVIFIAVMAVLMLISGIFTCLKQIWATYLGLVLGYISLLGNLIELAGGKPNILSLAIVIGIIVSAHRAISKANQLKKAGVPLTARPESLLSH